MCFADLNRMQDSGERVAKVAAVVAGAVAAVEGLYAC